MPQYIYDIGETATETATVKVNNVLTDAATQSAVVYSPSRVSSNPSVDRDSVGTYHINFDITEEGLWWGQISTTGPKSSRQFYVLARRQEAVVGSRLIAEALVTVPDMLYVADRQGATSIDEIRWLEDLINEASLAIAHYCNRQFTPERTAANRWPLQSDPLATGVRKVFDYRPGGFLSLEPYEIRTVASVVLGYDLPVASQVTLSAGDATHEAEYRFVPASAPPGGTYWSVALPTQGSPTSVVWASSSFGDLVDRQVAITGDWGAAAGMVPHDVARAAKIAVADWFRNPEGYARRRVGELDIEEAVPESSGALPTGARLILEPFRRTQSSLVLV